MITDEIIEEIWDKAIVVAGYDNTNIRKDACGAWIIRSHYGMRDSDFGWEIDHVYPVALGGDDTVINLRAMHWENNLSKGDDYPAYKTAVHADGNKNVHQEGQYTVNKSLQQELDKLYQKE